MHQCEKGPRLLADVGGTNARFGWQRAPGGPIEHVQVLPCAEFPSLQAAIEAYVARAAVPRPLYAAVAIANPVCGDAVCMTNHHWSFSIEQLRQALGLQRLLVLNDFTALALALPGLPAAALRPLGGGPAVAGAAVGLIGPGTGLGVSGLVPDGQGGWIPLEGEGGHVTLAAITEREWCVVRALQRRYGHVSAERVLSGPGLRDLYTVLCEADGVTAQADTPQAVVALAQQRQDERAWEAAQLFSGWLGSCAGNLALTLGARGGVYIGGGVVQRLGDAFDEAVFRERFEAKGRFAAYLAAIPVWLIVADPSPALAGAAAALDSARYR
ncbi:glucokinase [Tepidimonas taiwanensis]|uniref:Glucokinase n=3 Tax=Tepidimonas taiwanensis TaxID=307486 RepID=A0A554X9Y1_9BURK|nr:glucokinase [Tepidimonas taiwanensis]MCX7693067.1 glucokinase [Tepidimonas taiwanensis]TSE32654.1 Glucokinase [Tepidimonas taiwanensis]UBQ05395.1 glucokinase [Tepidimonas taiwanensis]